jgi:stearoyl-CoA desaturase (delta-9 desaturase)
LTANPPHARPEPAAGPARRGGAAEPLPAAERAAILAGVAVPFLGLVAAVALLWGPGVGWVPLGLLAGMYALTFLGISVGYHRLFTHRAFETGRAVQFALAALGSMAAQGPLLQWVATHRRHHQHSDRPGDPHTPHHHGRGARGWLRGAWHAHIGWMFTPRPAGMGRYVADLRRSAALRAVSALYPAWAAAGLVLPAAVGGLSAGTWSGALLGFVWGGLVRVFVGHHVTFSVNSVCHLWGGRPFPGGDQSRNNFLVGVLALGEGWHNNHHAFPTSARHGLRWWQADAGYWAIRGLAACGLAWGVRVPTPRELAGRARV